MAEILYCNMRIAIIKVDDNTPSRQDEVFDLLRLDTSNADELLRFIAKYGVRYTRGSRAILPNVSMDEIDVSQFDKVGLCVIATNNGLATLPKEKESNYTAVGELERERVLDALKTVKLLAYLLLFGNGDIDARNFKERCRDNDIDLRVGDDAFSVNVPPRYFAVRDENASDLLTFENGRAVVPMNEKMFGDLPDAAFLDGDDLRRLAALVLAEKLINEQARKPFFIRPDTNKFMRRDSASLTTVVADMVLAEKIVACPQCGRLVIRKTDKSSRFNCGIKGHQVRYNEAAWRMLMKGAELQAVIDQYPHISEKTIRNWQR